MSEAWGVWWLEELLNVQRVVEWKYPHAAHIVPGILITCNEMIKMHPDQDINYINPNWLFI